MIGWSGFFQLCWYVWNYKMSAQWNVTGPTNVHLWPSQSQLFCSETLPSWYIFAPWPTHPSWPILSLLLFTNNITDDASVPVQALSEICNCRRQVLVHSMCQSIHETWWKDKILKLARCPLSIDIQAAHLVGPLDFIQNCGGSYNVFHLMYKNVNCEGTDS